MTKYVSVLPAILGLLPTAHPSCEPDDPPEPRATPAPCPIDYHDETIRCGYIDVPEDYDDPRGRRIRLPFARVPARKLPKLPDPLVYLDGGPGGSAMTALLFEKAFGTPLLDPRRDQIFLETRGAGYSDPSLFCDELRFDDLDVSAIRPCHDGLEAQGIDLSQHRTGVAARDVAAARRALRYDQWNVIGTSYGTTLAMVAMREDPNGIRSVVLDSPTAPQVDVTIADVRNTLDQVSHYADLCAHDSVCASRVGDLREALVSAVTDLQANPLPVPRLGDFVLDGSSFFQLLQELMMQARPLPFIPALIHAAATRDADGLATILGKLGGAAVDLSGAAVDIPEDVLARRITLGLTFTVYCADLQDSQYGPGTVHPVDPWPDSLIDLAIPQILPICRAGLWPVPASPIIDRSQVDSSIPTLILYGELDPVSSRLDAEQAAAGLTRNRIQGVPWTSHGVAQQTCARNLIQSFLAVDQPNLDIDPSCVAEIPPVRFEL